MPVQIAYTEQIEEAGDYPPELAALVKYYEGVPYTYAKLVTSDEQAAALAAVIAEYESVEDASSDGENIAIDVYDAAAQAWKKLLVGADGSLGDHQEQ